MALFLTGPNIDPWLDTRNLVPGREWRWDIDAAVRDSHVVLVCVSENSVNKEGFVQKELRTALDVADEKPEDTIYIIPLRLDGCRVPRRLQDKQWIDYRASGAWDRLYLALDSRAQQLKRQPRDPSLPFRRKYPRHTHQIHFLYQDKPEDAGWEINTDSRCSRTITYDYKRDGARSVVFTFKAAPGTRLDYRFGGTPPDAKAVELMVIPEPDFAFYTRLAVREPGGARGRPVWLKFQPAAIRSRLEPQEVLLPLPMHPLPDGWFSVFLPLPELVTDAFRDRSLV